MCQARGDELDENLCRHLADSGCVQIEIGVESGDYEIRAESCKRIDNKQIQDSFKIAAKVGIQTKANFVFGFPKETKQTIFSTIKFAKTIDPTYANFFHLVPLPGSDYFQTYKDNGWIVAQNFQSFGYHGKPVVSVPGASAQVLGKAKQTALLKFYLRPAKIFQMIKTLIESRDPSTLARGFFGLINGILAGFNSRR